MFSPLRHAAIEAIWIDTAAELGWEVERTAVAFATSDGRRTIGVGKDELLDAEDSVAQLVFHELCHALVEGPAGWSAPDWGLSNTDARDIVAEHACLRVQIHLAAPHGLRAEMAPTTEYRGYHDALIGDPLLAGADAAAARAREALARPEVATWIATLGRALARTRLVLDGARETDDRAHAAVEAPDRHPLGFAWGPPGESCGSCAWRYIGGRGTGVERCRQAAAPDADGPRTSAATPSCARWEEPVACQSCGACCREAYHSVTVSVRDPVVWKQPSLIARHGHRFELLREGPRCAALSDRRGEQPPAIGAATPPSAPGSESMDVLRARRTALARLSERPETPAFSCTIYDDRPRACRDFEAGGRHCLTARRRVGLSA